MRDKKISEAEFGRLIGRSRQRVNQLKKIGVIEVDADGGVKLFRSLENYFRYKYRGWYSGECRIFL